MRKTENEVKCEENWRIAEETEKRQRETDVEVEEKIKVKVKTEKRQMSGKRGLR